MHACTRAHSHTIKHEAGGEQHVKETHPTEQHHLRARLRHRHLLCLAQPDLRAATKARKKETEMSTREENKHKRGK